MLAIKVHLLNGTYRATYFDNRARPEWPPHPARLFYAAVDAVFGGGSEAEPTEVEMLYAWEALGAPSLICDDTVDDAGETSAWRERAHSEHFVPGNSARSHRRDLQSHWSKIEDLTTAVTQAADAKTRSRAAAALAKAQSKLRSDVATVTRCDGKETETVSAGVLELLPENRNKQPRSYPVVTPDTDEFTFVWDTDLPAEHMDVLDTVLGRITRLGHSTSQVSCHVAGNTRTPTWVPAQNYWSATHVLRTVETGVLDALRHAYLQHNGFGERTMHAEMTPYARPAAQLRTEVRSQNWLGDWIVLPLGRSKLPLSRTQDVARAVRAALISHAAEPVAPVISGHGPDNSHIPHLSILVLPNVTSPRSDGTIQAVAVGLPPEVTAAERQAVNDALTQWREPDGGYDLRLVGGTARTLGEAVLHAASTEFEGVSSGIASRRFWARRARSWSTVTPIALNRHPKLKASADFDAVNEAVAPLLADMCADAGLPRPIEVSVTPSPIWPTVPIVGKVTPTRLAYPLFRVGGGERGGPRKYTTHASFTFDEDVRGPIVLGAGRYFGYGLCYPTPKGVAP